MIGNGNWEWGQQNNWARSGVLCGTSPSWLDECCLGRSASVTASLDVCLLLSGELSLDLHPSSSLCSSSSTSSLPAGSASHCRRSRHSAGSELIPAASLQTDSKRPPDCVRVPSSSWFAFLRSRIKTAIITMNVFTATPFGTSLLCDVPLFVLSASNELINHSKLCLQHFD